MFQQTSLLSYGQLKNLGRKQQACLGVIQFFGAACNLDIANELDWPINRVTPRVKELRDLDKVQEAYRALNPETNRTVTYWKVK